MIADYIHTVGQLTLGVVALCIIGFDLKKMRIPDFLTAALLILFVGLCVVDMPNDFFLRLAISAGVFLVSFAAFFLRMMGGGDVKIMTSLALFIPSSSLTVVALMFSATLIFGTVLVFTLRRFLSSLNGWTFLQTNRMPMGVPIGLAALVALVFLR